MKQSHIKAVSHPLMEKATKDIQTKGSSPRPKLIRLINNFNLNKSFQPLSHRHLASNLSTFYICFHGHCSLEIREIIPVTLRRVRTTRSSIRSHPFQVSPPNQQTLSLKSSFIPRTCSLWDVLPSSCLLESYNLPSCKSKITKLDLISLLLTFPFFLPLLGLCICAIKAFPQNNSLEKSKLSVKHKTQYQKA